MSDSQLQPDLIAPPSRPRAFLQFWRAAPNSFKAGSIILLIQFLVAATGPFWAPYGAGEMRTGQPLAGMSWAHPFGVDQLGRDVFSRTVYGARVSLIVAFAATLIATIFGVIAGLLAGYYRGWTDTVISRFVDVLLAIPYLLLATGLAAACTLGQTSGGGSGCLGGIIKPGLGVVIFVIAFTSWTYMARIVRGQVLSLREKEFVEASRSMGASDMRIVFRELLPNLTAPIIVYASILIPQVILYEAALSFLGVGVTDQPSWGQMISDATPVFADAWWYMFFPGIALVLTVLAFNFVGDAMQDALNPKKRRS
jgi:peptide/nickel transport system permease protein